MGTPTLPRPVTEEKIPKTPNGDHHGTDRCAATGAITALAAACSERNFHSQRSASPPRSPFPRCGCPTRHRLLNTFLYTKESGSRKISDCHKAFWIVIQLTVNQG